MANTPAKRQRRSDNTFASESSAKKPKTQPSDYFEIRDVLEYKNGRYLVQWEDNPDTGEKYTPTWEPKKNLNEGALEYWKQNQAKQQNADSIKSAKKRSSESQAPYEESTPISVRGRRDKRRKIVESSPATENLSPSIDNSGSRVVGNTSGDSPTQYQNENSAQRLDPSQASPIAPLNVSYQSGLEEDSSDSDYESLHEPKGKELVSQATPQDPEVVLSQKTIHYEDYTSFSAPETQVSPTDSTFCSQVQSIPEGESPTNYHIVGLGNSSSRAIGDCSQISTEKSLQEFAPKPRISKSAPQATKDHLQEHAPDRSVQQLTQEAPRRPVSHSTVPRAVSDSLAEPTQEPSRDNVTSEPTTNSKPSDECYAPGTGRTLTTTESHVEDTSSEPSHAQHTSSTESTSSPAVKVVPDSQIVDDSGAFAPPGISATSHSSFSTTSGSVTQDQSQDIPESSPIEQTHNISPLESYTLARNSVSSPSGPESDVVDDLSPFAQQLASAKHSTSSTSSPPPTEEAEKTQSTESGKQASGQALPSPPTDGCNISAETIQLSESVISVSGTQVSDFAFAPTSKGSPEDSSTLPPQTRGNRVEPANLPEPSQTPDIHNQEDSTGFERRNTRAKLSRTTRRVTEVLSKSRKSSLASQLLRSQSSPPSQVARSGAAKRLPRLVTPSHLATMSETGASDSFNASDLDARLSEMRSKATSNPPQPQLRFRERRRRLSKANTMSPEGGTRSPSAIPHSGPEQQAPEPSATRSTMLATLLPEQVNGPGQPAEQASDVQTRADGSTTQSESHGQVDSGSRALASSQLGTIIDEDVDEHEDLQKGLVDNDTHRPAQLHSGEELVLALPMGGSQRDSYRIRVRTSTDYAPHLFPAFVKNPHNGTRERVVSRLDLLHDILLHLDLDSGANFFQEAGTDQMHAIWAETCCFKFKFLALLLEKLRNPEKEIAIFVKPGHPYDVVVQIFKGWGVRTYSDLAGNEPVSLGERANAALTARIYSTKSPPESIPDQVSLIIGLDSTFYPGFVKNNFAASNGDGNLPPSLRLLIANSIEHFDRWIKPDMDETERLQTLVQAVAQFQGECGIVPDHYPRALPPEPKERIAAQLVALAEDTASFLEDPENGATWPTLERPPKLEEVFNSQQSSTKTGSSQVKSGDSPLLKRPMDDSNEESTSSSKRARTSATKEQTPEPSTSLLVNASEQSTTHITDSAEQPKSPASQNQEVLQQGVSKDDAMSILKASTELRDLSSRTKELHKALEGLQLRFEDQRTELTQTYYLLDTTKTALEKAERRLETQAQTLTTLRTERATLRTDLDSARTTLLTTAAPPIAELETLRAAVRTAESSAAASTKRLETQSAELAYTRTQYQTASSAAAELGSEVADLRADAARLTQRAEGHALQLRQTAVGAVTAATASENERLRVQLGEREALLRRKEDEIRVLREQRLGGRAQVVTRAGSATPIALGGSPRLGPVAERRVGVAAATTGAAAAGGGGRVQAGSRGVSPALGAGGMQGAGGHAMERGGSRGGAHPLRKG
ncbi:MAG: hypothetical protein Q9165_008354 [Trypethelium subeluteriae]